MSGKSQGVLFLHIAFLYHHLQSTEQSSSDSKISHLHAYGGKMYLYEKVLEIVRGNRFTYSSVF